VFEEEREKKEKKMEKVICSILDILFFSPLFQLPPSSAKSAPRRFVRVPISIEQVKDSRYLPSFSFSDF